MSERSSLLPKTARKVIHLLAAVLLNLGIVFSGVYILFHILDKYNPHRFIYSNVPWLPVVIPVLFILAVLLYDFLFFCGAFKKHRFHKNRMWLISFCTYFVSGSYSSL